MIAGSGIDLAVGELQLVSSRAELQWGAQRVPLTPREQTLLTLFLAAPGEPLAVQTLEEALGPQPASRPSNRLAVYIYRLRRKLAQLQYPGGITRCRGLGYRFQPTAEALTAWTPATDTQPPP